MGGCHPLHTRPNQQTETPAETPSQTHHPRHTIPDTHTPGRQRRMTSPHSERALCVVDERAQSPCHTFVISDEWSLSRSQPFVVIPYHDDNNATQRPLCCLLKRSRRRVRASGTSMRAFCPGSWSSPNHRHHRHRRHPQHLCRSVSLARVNPMPL